MLSIILRYVALVALYMLVGCGAMKLFGTFNIWRALIMGCVFCAIILAISEYKKRQKQVHAGDDVERNSDKLL